MQSLLIAAAVLTGALVPLQLAFDGQLGGVTRNVWTASLIVFVTGTVVLGAIVLVARPPLPSLGTLVAAPPTAWLGGLIATDTIEQPSPKAFDENGAECAACVIEGTDRVHPRKCLTSMQPGALWRWYHAGEVIV